MEMRGERRIAADRPVVWAALTDPDMLRRCVPGCSEMTGTPEHGFDTVVVQRIGPLRATFRGRVTVQDLRAPERLTIRGEGRSGIAGHGHAEADVRLGEIADGTLVRYDVKAEPGGRLAKLGGRIVGALAALMVEQFFARLQKALENGAGPGAR